MAQKSVEERRLAGTRLAQDHRAAPGRNDRAYLVEPHPLGRRGHKHAGPLAHQPLYTGNIAFELIGAAAIGLGEHHRGHRPAIERENHGTGDAVEQHLAGTERLHDQDIVDVRGEHLALPAGTPAPALERGPARQNSLDHAHVVSGGQRHGHAIAHRRQQTLLVGAPLGKRDGMLRTEQRMFATDEGEPAIQADHAAQTQLLGRLGVLHERPVGGKLCIIDGQLGKSGHILKGIDGRKLAPKRLGGNLGCLLAPAVALGPRPGRLLLSLAFALRHAYLQQQKSLPEILTQRKSRKTQLPANRLRAEAAPSP